MKTFKNRWVLIIHGGAKEIAPEAEESNRAGLLDAVRAGSRVLEAGGTAVDACEASVRVLETLPVFNAGVGSDLNVAGEVEMCSAVMDGRTLEIGAVSAITNARHPVSVARLLLPEKPVLLTGEGAEIFARDRGAELCGQSELVTEKAERELESEHDTVGAVALDAHGNIAAATSTGGLTGAMKGRVGDSPMPGCGFYADNAVGGVALSGDGEDIARLTLGARIIGVMEHQDPQTAVEQAIGLMPRLGCGEAGAVAIDRQGRIGWAHNSSHFAVASIADGDEGPMIWLSKQEQGGT